MKRKEKFLLGIFQIEISWTTVNFSQIVSKGKAIENEAIFRLPEYISAEGSFDEIKFAVACT